MAITDLTYEGIYAHTGTWCCCELPEPSPVTVRSAQRHHVFVSVPWPFRVTLDGTLYIYDESVRTDQRTRYLDETVDLGGGAGYTRTASGSGTRIITQTYTGVGMQVNGVTVESRVTEPTVYEGSGSFNFSTNGTRHMGGACSGQLGTYSDVATIVWSEPVPTTSSNYPGTQTVTSNQEICEGGELVDDDPVVTVSDITQNLNPWPVGVSTAYGVETIIPTVIDYTIKRTFPEWYAYAEGKAWATTIPEQDLGDFILKPTSFAEKIESFDGLGGLRFTAVWAAVLFKVPESFEGSYMRIVFDRVFYPANPSDSPVVISSEDMVWIGPGDPGDAESWYFDPVLIAPPEEVGRIEIRNMFVTLMDDGHPTLPVIWQKQGTHLPPPAP